MAGWFKQEPLPAERDAQGFPTPGELDPDVLAAAAKAGEDDIDELILEVVTSADRQNEEADAPQKAAAPSPLEAQRVIPAMREQPVTPGGIFAEPTIPRSAGRPAIDPTIPAPPPIPADPSGWPETWVPSDGGGASDAARPLLTQEQLRAALRTPKYFYDMPESRNVCRTCRHCWSGYAVAPVRSQSTTFFAQFRRCMAFPRFMIDLTEAQVVSCSMHAPGGAPAPKPPELVARDRARGIEDE